jgi:hypothetical protein
VRLALGTLKCKRGTFPVIEAQGGKLSPASNEPLAGRAERRAQASHSARRASGLQKHPEGDRDENHEQGKNERLILGPTHVGSIGFAPAQRNSAARRRRCARAARLITRPDAGKMHRHGQTPQRSGKRGGTARPGAPGRNAAEAGKAGRRIESAGS